MVRYVKPLKLGKAGLDSDTFKAGFGSQTVRILVGDKQQEFNVHLKHICHIDHFAKAFTGNFSEATSKTIELPDEDPEAFSLFLEWLYRGFQHPKKEAHQYGVLTWTRFYIMMDKWCQMETLPQVARHIWNLMMHSLMTTDDNKSEREAMTKDIQVAYRLCEGLSIRMAFVNARYQMNRRMWPGNLDNLPTGLDYVQDLARWSWVLLHGAAAEPNPVYNTYKHETLVDDHAHFADRLLLPLLFDAEKWTTSFSEIMPEAWVEEKADQRKWFKAYLKM